MDQAAGEPGEALADIRCESAVIDGELVFPNASGILNSAAYRRSWVPTGSMTRSVRLRSSAP